MNLHQITTAIQALNGEIIALAPASFGFVVRAMINGRSCRIILPKAGQKTQVIPQEQDCETLIVTDDQSLQTWLDSLPTNDALQTL